MKNTNSIEIKLVPINDMPDILNITEQAKKLLKKNGSQQWQQGYPNEECYIEYIKKEQLYGIYENNKLVAFGAYLIGIDNNYIEIQGKWSIPVNDKDMSIHTIAVSENHHGKKYGQKILEYGIEYARQKGCISVKVDTHKNNIPMQKIIEKTGFIYKGIIKIIRDKLENERLAYEYIINNK